MTDEKKSYSVTDRRQFTLDGEPVGNETVATEPATQPAAEPSAPVRGAETFAPPPPADFISFIMSLGAQAGVLLSGTEGGAPDLGGAKWLITILEMLQDKTAGRRTDEETEALDAILYELRLAFVKRSGAGGA